VKLQLKALRYGSHMVVPANYTMPAQSCPCLYLTNVRQMTPPERQTSDSGRYSFIDPGRMKGWVGHTHITYTYYNKYSNIPPLCLRKRFIRMALIGTYLYCLRKWVSVALPCIQSSSLWGLITLLPIRRHHVLFLSSLIRSKVGLLCSVFSV